MKATLTVGISGSGKSTWATEQKRAAGSCVDIVNRDDLRWQISGKTGWGEYKFRKNTEDAVTHAQRHAIELAAIGKRDVIIADTNLNPRTRKELTEFCESFGYDVIIKDFPITLEEAWKRDQFRGQFSVGREVLYRQWQQWNEYIGRKVYVPDVTLPEAIMFDIDGTLAHMNNKRAPFEWDKVFVDDVDQFVRWMAVEFWKSGHEIIILSGRDSSCRGITQKWLSQNHIEFDELFMRPEGDMRKDSIIKEEIFWCDVAPKYNVLAVVDDRPQVVRMWYDVGIPKVVSVGNPYIEF